MSDDIARLIESAVRKVEATKRTEAKLAEAVRRQDDAAFEDKVWKVAAAPKAEEPK